MLLKNLKLFNIFILFFFVVVPWQVSASIVCDKDGYTVLTINGILNKENDAVRNATIIVDQLGSTYKNQKLKVDYLYNESHLGGLGDIIDVVGQGLFDQKSDYDLVEMLRDSSEKIQTQKVLLVAHSQGNFYANNFYEKVANQTGGIPAQSLGVYGVATPAKSVAGGGKYITSDNDFVIATVAKKTLGGVLVPNIHIATQAKDSNGHSFTDVYMKSAGSRIISDIHSSLSKLSSNTIQKENEQCIDTPKLTLSHKLKKSVLAVADPLACVTKTVLVKTYQGATFVMNTGSNSIAWLFGKSVKLAKSFGKLSLLASAIPPEDLVTGARVDQVPAESDIIVSVEENLPSIEEKNRIDGLGGGGMIPDDSNNAGGGNEKDNSGDGENNNGGGGGDNSGGGSSGGSGGDGGVVDKTAPVITLTGDSVMNITKGELYTEQGATALDDIDGPRDVVIEGSVDVATIGTYTVTYTATDISNNIGTATRTVNVVAIPEKGIRKGFNLQNKIMYRGPYVVCFTDIRTLVTSGNNIGVTDFISVTNWGTNYLQSEATNMTPNKNMHFIFGEWPESTADCQNGTHNNDYSQTFYYQTNMGSSVTFEPTSLNRITNFSFDGLNSSATVSMNDTYGISAVVSAETSLTNLVPNISVSSGATVVPASGVPQDFTSPVTYQVTSADGLIATYTVSVVNSTGHLKTFDANNKIAYRGKYLLCNLDTRTVFANGDNVGVTTFVSSTNWATSFMQNANSQMSSNTNFRFIFGNPPSTTSDCTNGTQVNDYSNSFYYTTSSGASIVYGTYVYTPPALSGEKAITSFAFTNAPEDISISLNEQSHEISVVASYGTDVSNLVPNISISSGATINPASGEAKDFTNPVTYTVTAEDSTTREYVVNMTVLSLPPPDPIDTTPPEITSYTFGGTAGDITVDPVTNPLAIGLVASEPVDWISVRVEKDGNPNVYKIFYSGSTCIDSTTTCTKTWSSMSKGILTDGVYKVKVSMKDLANNAWSGYLSPYTITVDTF